MCWKIDSAISREGTTPVPRITNAFGTAPRRGSGDGTTAHSTTSGCSIRALSYLVNDFRIERFTRTHYFAQLSLVICELLCDQHAPHRWRRTA